MNRANLPWLKPSAKSLSGIVLKLEIREALPPAISGTTESSPEL